MMKFYHTDYRGASYTVLYNSEAELKEKCDYWGIKPPRKEIKQEVIRDGSRNQNK